MFLLFRPLAPAQSAQAPAGSEDRGHPSETVLTHLTSIFQMLEPVVWPGDELLSQAVVGVTHSIMEPEEEVGGQDTMQTSWDACWLGVRKFW